MYIFSDMNQTFIHRNMLHSGYWLCFDMGESLDNCS